MTISLKLILLIVFLAGSQASVSGLYYWTWSSGLSVGGTNLFVIFSGYSDPDSALSNSASISVPSSSYGKYLGLGGGNSAGSWTSALVQQVESYCSNGKFKGYQGIAFDIEIGNSGLTSYFQSAFSACQSAGFKVLVTVSHSAPYDISDAATLMDAFFTNTNINYLSPQLYTTGSETANDYTTSGSIIWSQYANAKAKIVPSIVTGSLYPSAQSYFKGVGVTTAGYVQWSQTVIAAELTDTMATTQLGLTPLQIGLIVGGCCLFVVFVVLVIVWKKIQHKRLEEAESIA